METGAERCRCHDDHDAIPQQECFDIRVYDGSALKLYPLCSQPPSQLWRLILNWSRAEFPEEGTEFTRNRDFDLVVVELSLS